MQVPYLGELKASAGRPSKGSSVVQPTGGFFSATAGCTIATYDNGIQVRTYRYASNEPLEKQRPGEIDAYARTVQQNSKHANPPTCVLS